MLTNLLEYFTKTIYIQTQIIIRWNLNFCTIDEKIRHFQICLAGRACPAIIISFRSLAFPLITGVVAPEMALLSISFDSCESDVQ